MKVIASDYDGTLNHHGISASVRAAIQNWQAAGNLFGIVTGRSVVGIRSALMQYNIAVDFYISNNGAVIADRNGDLLSAVWGDPALSCDVIAYLLDHGGFFACVNDPAGERCFCTPAEKAARHADDHRFECFPLPEMPVTGRSCESVAPTYPAEAARLPFTQISTVCAEERAAEALTAALNRRYEGKLTALQNGVCIDIVPYDVDKAAGIKRLLALLSLTPDDVCTVGDNKNDLAMLRAFRSYAVQNAVTEVKQIADAIVYDIAELIEKELTP